MCRHRMFRKLVYRAHVYFYGVCVRLILVPIVNRLAYGSSTPLPRAIG